MNATLAHGVSQTVIAPSPKTASLSIIVSPRDCFSYIQQSLESLYRHTNIPFKLIYIDAGSPRPIQKYLARAAAKYDFTLIRSDRFLTPNQARNLGLSQVTTDYVVFIDNDIHVSSGWLETLWQCAQETGAAIVCPLVCMGKPLHQHIHLAGGEARIFMDIKDEQIRRRLYKRSFLSHRAVNTVKDQLCRRACDFAELRCLLVKRDSVEQIGYLDERLLSTQEDMDFCLSVSRAGQQIFCEANSVVTHVPQVPRCWSDLAYFMLRWSDAWEVESLMHFQQKWDMDMDQYFLQRYKQLGYCRRQTVLYPLLHSITRKGIAPWLESLAMGLERRLNQAIADRHARLLNNRIREIIPPRISSSARIPSVGKWLRCFRSTTARHHSISH